MCRQGPWKAPQHRCSAHPRANHPTSRAGAGRTPPIGGTTLGLLPVDAATGAAHLGVSTGEDSTMSSRTAHAPYDRDDPDAVGVQLLPVRTRSPHRRAALGTPEVRPPPAAEAGADRARVRSATSPEEEAMPPGCRAGVRPATPCHSGGRRVVRRCSAVFTNVRRCPVDPSSDDVAGVPACRPRSAGRVSEAWCLPTVSPWGCCWRPSRPAARCSWPMCMTGPGRPGTAGSQP